MKKETVHFEIRLGESPAGYALHPDRFDTLEQAREVVKTNYRERNKQDGHDRYWRHQTIRIAKVVTTEEMLYFSEVKDLEVREPLNN